MILDRIKGIWGIYEGKGFVRLRAKAIIYSMFLIMIMIINMIMIFIIVNMIMNMILILIIHIMQII